MCVNFVQLFFSSQETNEKRIQRQREKDEKKIRKQEEKERKQSQSRTRNTSERDVNNGFNNRSKAQIIMLDDSEECVDLGVRYISKFTYIYVVGEIKIFPIGEFTGKILIFSQKNF